MVRENSRRMFLKISKKRVLREGLTIAQQLSLCYNSRCVCLDEIRFDFIAKI